MHRNCQCMGVSTFISLQGLVETLAVSLLPLLRLYATRFFDLLLSTDPIVVLDRLF